MSINRTFSTLVFTAILNAFTPAHSSDQVESSALDLTTMEDLNKEVVSFYTEVNSKEIQIKGAIGKLYGDDIYFADASGRYKVKLDAGREVRRKIEKCELDGYEEFNSACQITAMAEVKIDGEDTRIGDGIEISLILYQVDSFENNE